MVELKSVSVIDGLPFFCGTSPLKGFVPMSAAVSFVVGLAVLSLLVKSTVPASPLSVVPTAFGTVMVIVRDAPAPVEERNPLISTERLESGWQLENGAVAAGASRVGRAIEIAARVHDQPGEWPFSIGAAERDQCRDEAAACGHLKNGAVAVGASKLGRAIEITAAVHEQSRSAHPHRWCR